MTETISNWACEHCGKQYLGGATCPCVLQRYSMSFNPDKPPKGQQWMQQYVYGDWVSFHDVKGIVDACAGLTVEEVKKAINDWRKK